MLKKMLLRITLPRWGSKEKSIINEKRSSIGGCFFVCIVKNDYAIDKEKRLLTKEGDCRILGSRWQGGT